ncbi:MAG: DUF2461 domain-containing protein [Myxococcales bacterium]|nr:DUF2461 domain-containing protein [Myxococcales bacterium]
MAKAKAGTGGGGSPPRAEVAGTRFEGFASLRFFEALAKSPTREWFMAHKSEYEQGFAQPMAALLAELRQKLDRAYPDCELGEPKVFRLNRDVRFSADKTPYKTAVSGVLAVKRGLAKPTETPAAMYVELGVETAGGKVVPRRMAGFGLYMMDAPQLARFRAALLDEGSGAEVAKLVLGLEKRGFAIGAAETLKSAPRGVDPGHPRVALLRHKGLALMSPAMPARLHESRELVPWLVEQGKLAAPLVRWLTFAVG